MAEAEEKIPKGSLTNTWTAVTTWLEWTAEDIGLWGGIKVFHRALRVPRGVANGELIRAENGGLRQN